MPDRPDSPTALRAALRGTEAFVFDADGVLILKGEPLPGVVAALASLEARGVPYRVVTNFSMAHRATLAASFTKRGTPIDAERIITATSAAAGYTAVHFAGRRILVLAAGDALREFEGQSVVSVAEADELAPGEIAAVVIGDAGNDLTFGALDTAFRQIRGGAAFLAMHRNPWWLTPKGPTLDAGALIVGLEFATGVKATVLGKPSPEVFRQALAMLRADLGRRVPASAVAMVGDDPDADVRAAQQVGLRGVLVLTGKTSESDLANGILRRGRSRRRPDAIAPSLPDVVAALESG
jgi:HAD superfamily hydrolase (TIGR01450 family)